MRNIIVNISKLRADIRRVYPATSDRALARAIAEEYPVSEGTIRSVLWREANDSLNPRIETVTAMADFIGKELCEYVSVK